MDPAPANPSREALFLKPSWKSYFVFYAAIFIFGVGPALNPEAPLSREAGVLIAAVLAAFIILIRKYSSYKYAAGIFSREFGRGSLVQVKKMPLGEVASVVVRTGGGTPFGRDWPSALPAPDCRITRSLVVWSGSAF